MKEIQCLLNSVNSILREEKVKKEESFRRGERFNMFMICGIDHYEVMHSSIIASFLDPQGSHGQRNKYLDAFITIVGDKTGIDTLSCSVYTEYVTNEGRIDILIEDDKGKCIIIENKIYAVDQDRQLVRYQKFANEKFGEGQYAIYYLTLDGHDANDNSSNGVTYKRISFRYHILSWIAICIKESAFIPLIRETLIQYRNHIKQLTNQDMEANNKEELLKQMVENAEAVKTIFIHQDDYKKYVFNRFFLESSTIIELCKERNLNIGQSKMFVGGAGKGFYFYKKEWKSAAIWFYTDRSGEWDFYWGISNYNEKLDVSIKKIDCLRNEPIELWPYGWEYLEMYRNWDWNVFEEMINGNFAKYIRDLVILALDEIEKRQLPMP